MSSVTGRTTAVALPFPVLTTAVRCGRPRASGPEVGELWQPPAINAANPATVVVIIRDADMGYFQKNYEALVPIEYVRQCPPTFKAALHDFTSAWVIPCDIVLDLAARISQPRGNSRNFEDSRFGSEADRDECAIPAGTVHRSRKFCRRLNNRRIDQV